MSRYRLLLPKAKFPLRTNHAVSDSSIREAVKFQELYKWQLENRKGSKTFVLHDGPPYANGEPHMGHALNKILKDIINRYKMLRGYRVIYRPGWDCHGLPIELKACTEGESFNSSLTPTQVRENAAMFARNAMSNQKEAFMSWGCMGDWENPYLTMSGGYEEKQLGIFYDMYKRGCIYRGFKPVYWSPSTLTALAESELQYSSHVSKSVFALFPLTKESTERIEEGIDIDISALVWTTTPWTLISNKAICYNPDHNYTLVRVQAGEFQGKVLLVGTKALENMSDVIGEYFVLGTCPGSELEGMRYYNPIDETFQTHPFLPGSHVEEDEGTGLVHTAPAHGQVDYSIGLKHGLSLKCVVDDNGNYTEEAGPGYQGLDVLGEGNKYSIEKLRESGYLLHLKRYSHLYPCDWRSKEPVIIRATEQWFASVKSLKEQARRAIEEDITMHPVSAKNKLIPMLEGRDDWCISRQRSWGVPLPVFYHKGTGEPLITEETVAHLRHLVLDQGVDCWWKLPISELLPPSLRSEADNYEKGKDTMDVWFDSGSSWASVLEESGGLADMYLEGSDQHRGWFLSSLLTSVAVRDKAPYKSIVTHGFVLDKTGNKMSKSVGNVTSPDDIIKKQNLGVDVLRMWVASGDFTQDIQLTNVSISQNQELVRRVRNSCRFMLGNLEDFDVRRDLLPHHKLSKLDRYILHVLRDYDSAAKKAYDTLNFVSLNQRLYNFLPFDLSAFHFNISKDRLYCEAETDERRRSSQTALYHILTTLVKSVAPVIPLLAEEVCQHHPLQESVFRSLWEEPPREWEEPALFEQMQMLRSVMALSTKAIEVIREKKSISSSLEAELTIHTPSQKILTTLTNLSSPDSLEFSLADYFLVSKVTPLLVQREESAESVLEEGSATETESVEFGGSSIAVKVTAKPVALGSQLGKCNRCWKWVCSKGMDLCERCEAVEREPQRLCVQE